METTRLTPDFEFEVVDVARITGRGTSLFGRIVRGVIPREGARLAVWTSGRVIAEGFASVEDVRSHDPSIVTGLLFRGFDLEQLRGAESVRPAG